ncbi:hypothetical protein [Paraburkholderia bannensis]|uniref:hypothetical protein n=1 Tax=Paraburkholderia bannensis TaxID=765414 RepID=UPI000A9E95DF|nr:hypothetical protein [Paraburkholderia bannensis]
MSRRSLHDADWRRRGVAVFSGRLLVRPAARPDESFHGYRLRVAFANGLSNPLWLDNPDVSLPKAHGIARWCPHCLSGPQSYWREAWSTGPAACIAHRSWLISECVACRRMLRWKQVRFAFCTCGASLCEAAVEPFSDEVLKLFDEQVGSGPVLLQVNERWNLARYLGALSQFGLRGKPLKRASRRTQNIEQQLVTAGASLITDRSACFELLDRLRVPPVSMSDVPLLSEIFPQLLAMLRKQLSEAERLWMLDLLGTYVEHSLRRGTPVLWERKRHDFQVPAELGSRPKLRNPVIANLLVQAAESVPVRRTRAGRRKFAISDEQLLRLRKSRNSLVALKTAARYAGMSRRRVQALVEAGLIASSDAWIDTRSIDRLLHKVATACGQDAAVLEDPVSLAEALRLYVPIEASSAFFSGIMDRPVRLALSERGRSTSERGRSTLRDVFVERSDVMSVAQKAAMPDSRLSVVDAARRLGVKQEVMYQLINAGFIRAQTRKLRHRTGRVVDIDDLRKFDEQFAPLVAVARAMGISPRKAPSWARQHDIEIVTGPSIDGGRQYWIRRQTDAENSLTSEDEE